VSERERERDEVGFWERALEVEQRRQRERERAGSGSEIKSYKELKKGNCL